MKSIMISIHPEWVEKIANGIKSIEVRSSAPKDWKDYLSGKTKIEPKPRTAFIYCTNGKPLTRLGTLWNGDRKTDVFSLSYPPNATYNGKVVAKFRLEKVDYIERFTGLDGERWSAIEAINGGVKWLEGVLDKACLTYEQFASYKKDDGYIYAWHISDLEIFDEPKPLSEFGLTKAPQSWQYVEVEE